MNSKPQIRNLPLVAEEPELGGPAPLSLRLPVWAQGSGFRDLGSLVQDSGLGRNRSLFLAAASLDLRA